MRKEAMDTRFGMLICRCSCPQFEVLSDQLFNSTTQHHPTTLIISALSDITFEYTTQHQTFPNSKMKLSLLCFCAFAAVGLAVAIPEPEPQQVGTAANAFPRYRLKTEVIEGDATKDGLYVATYHIGAALNDAVLVSEENRGTKGYLNLTSPSSSTESAVAEGNWIFELNGFPYPSGFEFQYDQYYTRWLSIQINVGPGDPGFYLNTSTLTPHLVTSHPAWTGWIVCDWWHTVPQLFWQYYFTDFEVPGSCARVRLVTVAV